MLRIYYFLKPIIPWNLIIWARRLRAQRRLKTHAAVWPVDPRAAAKPEGWPGWPDGKRFAVVLTHDVEGPVGMNRSEKLAAVDAEFGFRSSFNFVPEGSYRVSESLRQHLEERGFEVGVHGLHHDGKLYSSKETFGVKAAKIRNYMRQWGAVGFRSPFMHHRLEWLHTLGGQYDASTFDTDPFEPQSDGAGTIFPYWVSTGDGNGYVELPYTLVQDNTLFIVLRESDASIWKNKVDWIAEHGGMVLLNSHPDYVCFDGQRQRDGYPVSYYKELLAYIRDKYAGAYWNALPRDVAQYYRSAMPEGKRNTRRKICMVAYTQYEADNRVRRYAETLARRGDEVHIIALAEGQYSLGEGSLDGVTIHRIRRRELNERSKLTYAWRLLRFLFAAERVLNRLHDEHRFDLIHVHNIPDFLVFSAWRAKRKGARIILDIHDVVPELFSNKFGAPADGMYVRFLKWVERVSARFSDHVIVSNHLWYERLIQRAVDKSRCSVYINHVDSRLFTRKPRTRKDDRIIMIFPGTFQRHQGLDVAIRAMPLLRQKWPTIELHLYGNGSPEVMSELNRLVDELKMKDAVKFCGGVPFDRISEVMANADIGIVPKRADTFGNEAYSTKIMEFMSQSIPVVASRTKIDTCYFDDSTVRFFESGNSPAMADAVSEVLQNRELRETMIENGLTYAAEHNWGRVEQGYLKLVDTLITEPFDIEQEAKAAVTIRSVD